MKKIMEAIESKNEKDVVILIQEACDLNTDVLDKLLEVSSSVKMNEIIKNEFNKKFGLSINKEQIAKHSVNEINEESINIINKQDISYELSDDSYENLTEEEAIKKHKFLNSKHNKALEMFLASFKVNIEQLNYDKAVTLSKEIVDQIISEFSATFPKEVRSKSHNLKENKKLCENLYYKTLETADFIKMTAEQMQSEESRSKDSEYIKDSILASQVAKVAADTNMFKCGKCKQRKCTYSQLQTRSCDEPMTTFVTCTVCNNRWKF